ncbi:hypothetical protein LshimejAT787_1302360 [Lyophyllum shimeji]|uniref:Uncharacterized protein n=1 Tax=Lyophyllum shimeji TaxID=47721 RepID=A0A9P3PUU6_LYOSH|nr:hypothetical protein LshimejAT787_1302360 [Lyophyllum shimeji]
MGKPLMPLLHTRSYPLTREIFLFLSPHLRLVSIEGALSPQYIDTGTYSLFVRALLDKAPGVERISTLDLLPPSALEILRRFSRPKYLDIGHQNIPSIQYLEMLLTLQHISELRISLPSFDEKLVAPAKRNRYQLSSMSSRHTSGRIEDRICVDKACSVGGNRLLTVIPWADFLQLLEILDLYDDSDTKKCMDPSVLDPLLKSLRVHQGI